MDPTLRTTQLLSLSTSLILSGANIGASVLTLPILYSLPPSTSTPIFQQLYTRGAVTLVPLSVFSASCAGLVAYWLPRQRRTWSVAGACTLAQLPWTLLVMKGTIDALNGIAASSVEQEKASGSGVEGLLRRWAWMNVVRGLMAMVGGGVGLWAIVQ